MEKRPQLYWFKVDKKNHFSGNSGCEHLLVASCNVMENLNGNKNLRQQKMEAILYVCMGFLKHCALKS